MDNLSVTASAIISFTERLEDESSTFYERLAERFKKDSFQAFARACRKNKMLVSRTYRETVSDALETGFSFEGLNLDNYRIRTAFSEETSYPDVLRIAIEIEEKASKFYLDVSKRAQLLLATIPRAFNKAGETRIKLKLELQSMLDTSL